MTLHPQKVIRWGDTQAEVDERLVGLILALWKHGVKTTYSCQDRGGRAWVQLPRSQYAKWQPQGVTTVYNGPAARDDPELHVYFPLEHSENLISALE